MLVIILIIIIIMIIGIIDFVPEAVHLLAAV